MYNNVLTKSKWLNTYGKIAGYYKGSKPFIVTTDIELLKRIQVSDFQHNFTQRQSRGVIGGLEASISQMQSLVQPEINGKRWKEQRSLITKGIFFMFLLCYRFLFGSYNHFLSKYDLLGTIFCFLLLNSLLLGQDEVNCSST
jgi:hypothetical protein